MAKIEIKPDFVLEKMSSVGKTDLSKERLKTMLMYYKGL